jgi:hypothetical protein
MVRCAASLSDALVWIHRRRRNVLDSLFAGMDFATATVSGGEILIDAANNVQLLERFEQNLAETMELEEGDG